MSEAKNFIGIFDSGIGGLTVLKKIVKSMPQENMLYFGDTARVPYGTKSARIIERYALENARFLSAQNIKALVIACNTASAYAAEILKERLFCPVIDVIDPAVELAVKESRRKKIAVLATKATINSGVYREKILSLCPRAEVFSIACPLLVPLVEENLINHPATEIIIRDYLKPLKSSGVDVTLLGCTHYPLLKELIRVEIGERIRVVDSAGAVAAKLKNVLKSRGLINLSGKGSLRFFVSDDPEQFMERGRQYLGRSIDNVLSFAFE